MYLTAARLAIRLLPFRRLIPIMRRAARAPAPEGRTRRRAIAEVRWAVNAASARLPGATTCLPRAVAAQAMLRRRGVGTSLNYGASTAGRRLEAHAWLQANDEGVVGHEIAADYTLIAAFSPKA